MVEKLKPLKDSLGWEDSDELVDRSVWKFSPGILTFLGKICYFFLTASVTHYCLICLFNTLLVIEHSRNQWFPSEMTSEERAEKFYADDVSLLRSE